MLPALNEKQNDILSKSAKNDWSVPEFKLKHFVAQSHVHPMHQIRQYMLELNAKQEMIEQWEKDSATFEIQIEIEQEKKEHVTYKAEAKLCDLEILDLERKIKIVKEKLQTANKERNKIFRLIEEFNESPKGRDERGVLYIDILSDREKSEEVEKEYWEYRLAKQAAMDMIAYGRIGVGNIEAITQLESDSQNKILAMAYEVLITNEARMNLIQDRVQERLQSGNTVSDITKLMEIGQSEFLDQLQIQEKKDVPLIQKR